MRAMMLLIGTAAAAIVLGTTWVDEGEVATLVTLDSAGRSMDSRLWIVDLDGRPFLRAPTPDTRWLERLREHPLVHLSRGDGIVTMRAVPIDDPRVREEVDLAMEQKYGTVDRLLVWLRDYSRSVPVRLDPLPTASR